MTWVWRWRIRLAAVHNGARQIECTINGIGERAGNTSLEEVVMALRTRKNYLDLDTNITSEQLYPTSRLVSQVTGIPIPINKPVVGDNAFAHEAGIHQDGVLKHKQTYEIMTPESIGIPGNRLVMGKHSGRHAFDERLKHLGFNLSKEDMNRAFVRFKELADKKKNVYDEDIEAIVAEEIFRVPGRPDKYELLYMNVNSSSDGIPSATVKMRVDGGEVMDYASGDGVVDACYKVITKITGSGVAAGALFGQRHYRRYRCSRRSFLRARRRRRPRVRPGRPHRHHHGQRAGLY